MYVPDGRLHETDSTESSELSSHGDHMPFKEHSTYTSNREHSHPERFEHTNHGTYDHFNYGSHHAQHNGEDDENSNLEDKHHKNHQGSFNSLQSEQQTDESRQHFASYNRHDKLEARMVPKGSRAQRKQKSKRKDEKTKRVKYEVKEPSQESSTRVNVRSKDKFSDYSTSGRRKHTSRRSH